MWKEMVNKFIALNKLSKDCTLNLGPGYLHAYPNGEIQFENAQTKFEINADAEVAGILGQAQN